MERIRRLDTWARLGYAARGVVYMLLGWIALSTGRGLTTGETVEAVDRFPGGTPLLVLLALGLFGYGAFKIYASVLDLYHKGSDAKGRAERGAFVAAGLAYLALAFVAVRQAWSHGGAAQAGRALGSGGAKQEIAQKVAASTGGGMLLVLAGVIGGNYLVTEPSMAATMGPIVFVVIEDLYSNERGEPLLKTTNTLILR